MLRDASSRYDDGFYQTHGPGMSISAAVVLGLLYKYHSFRTVVDIGCGQGAWLATARSLGARTLRGVDGGWVKTHALQCTGISFSAANLETELPNLGDRYELCISLEVAEHLTEQRAEDLADYLCGASDTLLFGAAVRYQGGTNHINEQWQSYWIDIFSKRDYECIDCIRPQIWENSAVEWWYRQNAFLFVKRGNAALPLEDLRRLAHPIPNIVHPASYEIRARLRNEEQNPSLRFCLECLKRFAKNKVRQVLAGLGLAHPL